MAMHSVESMVNMLAAIEADMLFQKYGFYGALRQIEHVEKFHSKTLLSESLKTFENKFWDRVRIFVEIKHPEMHQPILNEDQTHPFESSDLNDTKL